jgi:hypothetical protein
MLPTIRTLSDDEAARCAPDGRMPCCGCGNDVPVADIIVVETLEEVRDAPDLMADMNRELVAMGLEPACVDAGLTVTHVQGFCRICGDLFAPKAAALPH